MAVQERLAEAQGGAGSFSTAHKLPQAGAAHCCARWTLNGFQSREGHVQFRGPDSSHLLPASGQEPLRGPLQVLEGLRNMPTLF